MKKYLFVISFLVAVIIASPNISLAIEAGAGASSSYADLQAQIQALLAQIAALQAQMSQQQPQQWCYDFKYNLNAQSRGKEVSQLQTALEKEGFEMAQDEKTNQTFGESTADAVVGFQQKYKDEILSPYNLKYGTGFVGKSTRAKLNSLYGCGVIQPISTPVPVPTPIPVPIPFNQPPTINGVSGPTTLNINQIGTWEVKASDPEQKPMSYSVTWGDETIGSTGTYLPFNIYQYVQTVTFTHSYSKSGIYYPTFTVTDNQGLSAKTSISVKVGETSITQPILLISPTNVTVGNTYTFNGSVINAIPNSDVKLYLQRPNSTMKYENYYVGRTDLNGVLKITTIRTIPNAYCCTYSAWVEVGGQKSNPVNINITPAAQPSITVISPNGGEQWEVGKIYEVRWANNTGSNIRISLMKGGAYIGQNWNVSASLNSYNITIPSLLTSGPDYNIRISSVNSSNVIDGLYSDDSNSYFSIVAGTSAAPSLNIGLDVATPLLSSVSAEQNNVAFTKVKFTAIGSNIPIGTITVIADANYQSFRNIRIYDGATLLMTSPSLNSFGQAYFNLSNGQLVIPNNSSKIITIMSDITDRGGSLRLGIGGLAYGNESTGFIKLIGSSLPLYGNYMNVISAAPSIILLSPNGGETFNSGGSMSVKWSASQDYACKTIVLYLIPQAGTPTTGSGYITVANGYNIGGKSYPTSCSPSISNQELIPVIPNIPAGSYKIGVYVFDVQNNTNPIYAVASDQSDTPFNIVAGTPVSISSLTASLDSSTPAAGTVIAPGTVNAKLASFKLIAGSNNVSVNNIQMVRQGGTDTTFQNFKLYDGSTQIGYTIAASSNIMNFSFLPFSIPANSSKTMTLYADVNIAAAEQNIYFELRSISAVDNVTANTINPIGTPVYSNNIRISSSGSSSGGDVVAILDPDNLVGNITAGTEAVLIKIKFTAIGDDMNINKMRILISPTNSVAYSSQAADEISTINLYDGVTKIGSYYVTASGDYAGAVFIENLNWTIPKDASKTLTIKGVVNTVEGGADIGAAVYASLLSSGFEAKSINFPLINLDISIDPTNSNNPVIGNQKTVVAPAIASTLTNMICVDINNATYTGSISTGGGIWPGYNWGYGYGVYQEGLFGWLDYNKQNTGNYPLEVHYNGNSNYGINYGVGELKFTCDGAAKTAWLPAVSYPLGGSAPVLYVASDGSTYYDKALTKLARSAGSASIGAQQQIASVLQSAEIVLIEMFNYLNR